MLGRAAQDLRNPEEVRLLVPDDARVRGDRHLAVGEGVERVDGLVRRLVGRDLNDDFDLVGRIVVDLSDLDLALVVGLNDRILDRLGGRGIGNLGDGKRPFVDLRNLRPLMGALQQSFGTDALTIGTSAALSCLIIYYLYLILFTVKLSRIRPHKK